MWLAVTDGGLGGVLGAGVGLGRGSSAIAVDSEASWAIDCADNGRAAATCNGNSTATIASCSQFRRPALNMLRTRLLPAMGTTGPRLRSKLFATRGAQGEPGHRLGVKRHATNALRWGGSGWECVRMDLCSALLLRLGGAVRSVESCPTGLRR